MRQFIGWTLLVAAFILLWIVLEADWQDPDILVLWGCFLLSGAIMTGK